MGYQIYPRNLARSNLPVVSVTRLGRITLNAAAARLLSELRVESVFVLWDKDAKKFALKPTSSNEPTSYRVRFARENSGAGFSAKTFLKFIGYEFNETMVLDTHWNESQGILEVTLPSEGFNKPYRSPRQRPRRKKNSEGNQRAGAASGN